MSPCKNCFERNWKFEVIEDTVRATCNVCSNQVEFPRKEKEQMKLGDTCRKCKGAKVVVKNAAKPRAYYAYYWCPNCRTNYFSQEFLIKPGPTGHVLI
jgi:hypothetical protein